MFRLPTIIRCHTSLYERFLKAIKPIKLEYNFKILILNLYKDRHVHVNYIKVY